MKFKIKDMREIYIPSAETYVFDEEETVKGFVSLAKNTIATLFVFPNCQGRGIGTQLIEKNKRNSSETRSYCLH